MSDSASSCFARTCCATCFAGNAASTNDGNRRRLADDDPRRRDYDNSHDVTVQPVEKEQTEVLILVPSSLVDRADLADRSLAQVRSSSSKKKYERWCAARARRHDQGQELRAKKLIEAQEPLVQGETIKLPLVLGEVNKLPLILSEETTAKS
ncbi:hypothetical protein PR002_g1055 [Phytophthora rubi]|uniref:Uncharacterized protein n=1 Tax=Phytophthora rubi TaxID=129364 RepID=A0A6A3NPQ7_9STRA|nr:hypothetical protein PR002_g1055 [Phytophthora rubi]